MPTLKNHLLFEALDIAFKKMNPDNRYYSRDGPTKINFWGFDPKETCAFAISSSHAYRMLAYTVKNFATYVDEDPGQICLGIFNMDLNISVMSFSQECHIDVLMSLAGEYCTNIVAKWDRADNEFTAPFYDNLKFNNVLSTDTIDRDAKPFRAYIKGRNVIPSIRCALFSDDYYHCLQDVKGTVINELIIEQVFSPLTPSTFNLLSELKIVDLKFTDDLCLNKVWVYFDIFYKSMPQLKYMKSFDFHNPITVSAMLQMLQRYDVDKIGFGNVFFEKMRSPFNEYITELRQTVDTIWKTMKNCKGEYTHVVCTFANGGAVVPDLLVADVANRLNEVLPEFNILPTHTEVISFLSKTEGEKQLVVFLRFGVIV